MTRQHREVLQAAVESASGAAGLGSGPAQVAKAGENLVLAVQTGLRSAIALESNKGLGNLRGTVGMARNAAADSATSQFYFNVADNLGFDYANASNPGYAVFGKVVQGLAVMDAMGALPTTTKYGLPDVPVTNVVLLTAVQTR